MKIFDTDGEDGRFIEALAQVKAGLDIPEGYDIELLSSRSKGVILNFASQVVGIGITGALMQELVKVEDEINDDVLLSLTTR